MKLVQSSMPKVQVAPAVSMTHPLSVMFLELLSVRWRRGQEREHKTGGQRGRLGLIQDM